MQAVVNSCEERSIPARSAEHAPWQAQAAAQLPVSCQLQRESCEEHSIPARSAQFLQGAFNSCKEPLIPARIDRTCPRKARLQISKLRLNLGRRVSHFANILAGGVAKLVEFLLEHAQEHEFLQGAVDSCKQWSILARSVQFLRGVLTPRQWQAEAAAQLVTFILRSAA